MDTLIHADVFFFVTTIAVVVVGIAFTVVLVYLAKILRDVKEVTEQVKEETILFRRDIADLRGDVKKEGFRAQRIFMFFRNFFKGTEANAKTRSKKNSEVK